MKWQKVFDRAVIYNDVRAIFDLLIQKRQKYLRKSSP